MTAVQNFSEVMIKVEKIKHIPDELVVITVDSIVLVVRTSVDKISDGINPFGS